MFKKLAPWVQTLKTDFAGAIDAASKKAVLDDAKTVLDALFEANPLVTSLANFLIADLEAMIKA